jgi:hypothetical protein
MSRALAVLIALAACKHGSGETIPAPPLDEIRADARVAAAPADAPPPLVEMLGLQIEPIADKPPASAPTGKPIAIKFVAAKVGATRTRTQTLAELFRTTESDGTISRLQETSTTFEIREEASAVANNRVKRMRATIGKAEEVIALDGQRITTPLLAGTYILDIGGILPEDIKAKPEDPNRRLGTREDEELATLYSLDAASTTPFHELVWMHPLRVGESIVLSDLEAKTLLHGDPAPAPITFSLRDVTDGIATYQFDAEFEVDGEQRKVRQRQRVRVATGQLVEVVDVMRAVELRDGRRHEHDRQLSARFAW